MPVKDSPATISLMRSFVRAGLATSTVAAELFMVNEASVRALTPLPPAAAVNANVALPVTFNPACWCSGRR